MSNHTNTPSPDQPPLHYVAIIFPGYQLLDLAGPLDILNTYCHTKGSPQMTLTLVAETMDPIPTKLIGARNGSYQFDTVSVAPDINGDVKPAFNQYILPDATFEDYLRDEKRPIDVLFIPGGWGTRTPRVYKDGSRKSNIESLLDFVPRVTPRVRTAIMTVCTGSFALAQTGLLDGRRATTNMRAFEKASASRPQAKWQHGARWVRSQKSEDLADIKVEIWTSAGISAGMDVTLAFIAHWYDGGMELARHLATTLEYDWREIGEGEVDPLYIKNKQVPAPKS